MRSSLPACTTFSNSWIISWITGIFLSVMRMYGSFMTHSILSASETMYGLRYPRSNCIPSTTLRLVPIVLESSTVITPSLPTFSMASAIRLPMVESAEETEATCAILAFVSTDTAFFLISPTRTSTAFSIPFFRTIGFAPAATFLIPSWIMDWASSVAVVVPSPATSFVFVATSFTSWAPIFSKGSFSSISRAMDTPSLTIFGAPYFLSRTTLRPLGPRVIFTASASWSTPFKSALRASSL